MDSMVQGIVDVELPVRMELKPERVQEALDRLPSWKLREGAYGIQTVRRFATSGRAISFAAYSCRLASNVGQPVKVSLAGPQVTVILEGHPVRGCTGGLTDPVFRLADLIGS
jgi:pterin-4a-carbinolamine dehydratase